MAVLIVVSLLTPQSKAGAAEDSGRRRVDIVQLGGLLDTVNLDHLRDVVSAGDRDPATHVVVVQLDNTTTTASGPRLASVVGRIRRSTVPVAIWIGPAGSGRAYEGAAQLVEAADVAGIAPGSRVENFAGRRFGADAALADGVVDVVTPTVADFIGRLDGRDVKGRVLHTSEPHVQGTPFVLSRDLEVRFRRPGLVDRTLHALGSPSAVLLLLVLGLLLFLFEFYSAGVGIAAGAAAVCLALAAYGVGTLDVRPVGLLLLLLATFGFAVDIQAGVPRVWTGVGVVSLGVASFHLFDGLRAGWVAIALVTIGGSLFAIFGIPATVRTRFSTPTIGRGDLVGASGTALTAVDPLGTVEVRGAAWQARTFPKAIRAGEAIEVISVDGLVLEVVPEGTELLPPRHPAGGSEA